MKPIRRPYPSRPVDRNCLAISAGAVVRFVAQLALAALAAATGTAVLGCRGASEPSSAPAAASHGAPAPLTPLTTARAGKTGARFVPEAVVGRPAFGIEPGGGVRGIAAGLPYIALPDGAVLTGASFLPGASRDVRAIEVPARLHGGFAFLGEHALFRADSWLGEAQPVLTSRANLVAVAAALDRLYLSIGKSEIVAVDPATFAPVDLGRSPNAPSFSSYAAFDGWHAAALADLRGLVVTADAGASWQSVSLPFVPATVRATDAGYLALAKEGADTAGGAARGVLVDLDGHVSPAAPSAEAAAPMVIPPSHPAPEAAAFGPRPLLAAVEDGWPLADGTALVLRGGLLARISLTRGDVVDLTAADSPANTRCHAVSLGPSGGIASGASGAGTDERLGFVCGAPQDDTWIYLLEPGKRRLRQIGHFSGPRAVLAPENGRLAVHGSCDGHAPRASDVYCLSAASLGEWRELHLEGALDGERVVPLGRGGVAVLSPAHGALARMRLTVRDERGVTSVPLRVHAEYGPLGAPLDKGIPAVLKNGIWLDGVRETSPGVLQAWVDGHGSVLGLSIALDGDTTHGDWIGDLGSPFVSGAFGLGMTLSGRGFQTTDGGLHWSAFEGPAPLVTPPSARACGAVGCSVSGWLRIGWGEPRDELREGLLSTAARSSATPLPSVDPLHPLAPPATLDCRFAPGTAGHPSLRRGEPAGKDASASWSPYFGGAPTLPAGSRGAAFDVRSNVGDVSAAQVYVWAPKTPGGDDTDLLDAALPASSQPQWAVRWASPLASDASEARMSSAAPAPASVLAMLDASNRSGAASSFVLMAGEGPDDALLVKRRGGLVEVYQLQAGRPPLRVRDATGGLPTSLSGTVNAIEVGGLWYLASAGDARSVAGLLPAPAGTILTVVWVVEHGSMRLLTAIPRTVSVASVGLARREDGRAVALLVDGQPRSRGAPVERWALPIDVATGIAGEPESLGSFDLTDPALLAPCGRGEASRASRDRSTSDRTEGGASGLGWSADVELGLRTRMVATPEAAFLAPEAGRVRLHAASATGTPDAASSTGAAGGERGACMERFVASTKELVSPALKQRRVPDETRATDESVETPVVLESPAHRSHLLCRRVR